MKKKVLLVSIAFPPKKDPECIQTARYFKYLSQHKDLVIDVVTGKPPVRNMPVDHSLQKYDKGYRAKYEFPIKENRYWNFLKRKLGIFFKPDTKWAFSKNIAEFLEDHSIATPDIIYSRSYPITSAFAAHLLSQKFQKPWIMHLSDPWLSSPLHNYKRKERSYIGNWESTFIRDARSVTLTSELTVERYQKVYPAFAEKFKFLPNVYDDDDVSMQVEAKFSDKIRVVYTGGIMGNRNPLPLLQALDVLSQRERDLFEFIFVGDADASNRQLMLHCRHSCVKYLGLKSLEESLKFQKSANILLLIDNEFDHADDAVYFPSKLLDYMIQGKQILAITTLNGTTDGIMKSLGLTHAFGHNQVKEIGEFLRKTIENFKKGNREFFIAKPDTEKYAASRNAHHLYSIIQEYA